jgi:hypothetical protein
MLPVVRQRSAGDTGLDWQLAFYTEGSSDVSEVDNQSAMLPVVRQRSAGDIGLEWRLAVSVAVFITLSCTVFAGASFSAGDETNAPVIVKPVRIDVLQVRSDGGDFVLSMPASSLVMRIPQNDFNQKGVAETGATNPRYFEFKRASPSLVISGSFDNAERYPGAKKFWSYETKTRKQKGLPKFEKVKMSRIGNWDVVQFENPTPGAPRMQAYASLVQAGTWIFVQLASDTESREALLAVLKSISVTEREP